jgi:hypothetical protein
MKKTTITQIAILFAAITTSHAAVLMYDFGGSLGSGAVGPAHADGTIASSITTWQHVTTSAAPAGFTWGQESTTTSKVINWGSAALDSIGFGPPPGSVFANTVLGDTLRTTSNDRSIGIRLSVDPGIYAIYMTGDSDTVGRQMMEIHAGATPTVDLTTNYSSFTSMLLPNTTDSAFVLGDSYVRLEVTVGVGESLVIVSDTSTPSGEAVISSLQVVSIPEPSAMALGGIALVAIVLRRNRSRSRAF